MYWTLALSTVNVTLIKAVIVFWEWRVCLNAIFLICADFKEVLMEPSLLSRAQFLCCGWPNFGWLFDAATSTFKVLKYCFFCWLIVFHCGLLLFVWMSCRAKENVLNAESVILLHCPFQNCDKFYKNKKSLNEHLRLYPEHKLGGLPTSRKRVSLRQCADKFLDDESNPCSRKQRVSKLLNCLNNEELVDLVLPRIAKIVSPVVFLLHGTDGTHDFHSKLCKFINELFLRFRELQALFCPEPSPSTGFYNQRQVFTEIVQKNKPYSCEVGVCRVVMNIS